MNKKKTSNLEESNFVHKLKKGQRKYRGKLPFKCFSRGGIGYFTSKCPYKENNGNNEGKHENDIFKNKSGNFKKDKYKKKSFISYDKDEISTDSNGPKEGSGEFLFLA